MIVLLGDLLLDLFALPLGSTVETADDFAPRQGGAVANVAVALGLLGLPCRLFSCVGKDAHGRRLLRALQEAGVDARGVVLGAVPTGIVFIQIDAASGERSFVGYGGGAEKYLSLQALREAVGEPLENARWFHTGSGVLEGGPLVEVARWLIEEAQRRQIPVSVDLNIRRHKWDDEARMIEAARWLAARASVLRASEDDLRALGLPVNLDALAAMTPGVAVLTRGLHGAEARVREVTLTQTAHPAEAVDTTGAGDAFTAGLLSVIVPRGSSFGEIEVWREALATASRLGARVVGACGATEALRL